MALVVFCCELWWFHPDFCQLMLAFANRNETGMNLMKAVCEWETSSIVLCLDGSSMILLEEPRWSLW